MKEYRFSFYFSFFLALPSRRSLIDAPPVVDRSNVPLMPRRLSPSRYRPFSTLRQQLEANAPQPPNRSMGIMNPSYNFAQGPSKSSSTASMGPWALPPRNLAGITQSMSSIRPPKPNSAASFAAANMFGSNKKSSLTNSEQEKNLLGDFSSGFQNLSTTKDKNSNS